jgi:DNA-binding CsgD family transcriptional regulator
MQPERPWVESIVACLPDPLLFVRGDWTIIWANRELAALAELDGSPRARPLREFIEGWDVLGAQLDAAQLGGGRVTLSVVVTTPLGGSVPVELHVARALPGVDAAWILHMRSVGEVGDLRRRLSERERSHSFLQANTSDLIVRVDVDGVILWSNEPAAIFFPVGASLDAILGSDSLASLGGEGVGGARFDVAIQSREGIRPAFQLRGIARRLFDDQVHPTGLSLLLRDDSEQFRLARFAASLELSAREEEIVEYLVKGYSNLNIASILGLSESGVKFHIRNVFARAKVATRTELMALYLSD